ncbi:hypothetical protein LSTR_LSTR011138 [Laodelphax striatellus]|uniref:Uncharacterized protein n=1 Tax=Laodelphax striatellus TaxID=195883 RepID=A0A482X1L2_LAOST|nr:hypothetical protein LSTR_LSTR011138 [Laodelphax striatellus]
MDFSVKIELYLSLLVTIILTKLNIKKKAIRSITFSGQRDHCKPLFRDLKILIVHGQYILSFLMNVSWSSQILIATQESPSVKIFSSFIVFWVMKMAQLEDLDTLQKNSKQQSCRQVILVNCQDATWVDVS